MLKRNFLVLLLCLFAAKAFADIPESSSAPNEFDEVNEIESAVPETETLPAKPSAPVVEEQQLPSRHNEGPAPTEKASSGSGEVIFDWSKHQGETEVKHPFAEKGLIRITKDKTYIYKVQESESKRAMSVQVGLMNPTQLKNPDATEARGSTFKENYDQTSNPTILLTREWDWLHGALGKINLRGGSGAFVAQGHGHFVGEDNKDKVPLENLTFIAFPLNAGVVYRLQFSDRPLLVPYVEGGGTGWAFTEIRDDKKGPKFGGSLSAYGAAGVALNMTYFDSLTRIHMDREYGITGVFVTLEYRRMQAILQRYDFSSDFVNAGFLMQY